MALSSFFQQSRAKAPNLTPVASPMPLSEAAECCGEAGYHGYQCDNCPLLIERRERVMRAARAL